MSTLRTTLSLKPGVEVFYKERRCHITHILDLSLVLVSDSETNHVEQAKIADLKPVPPAQVPQPKADISQIPDAAWQAAERKYEIIRPLLEVRGRTLKDVEARAKEYGIHATTLYKWIRKYEAQGRVTALQVNARSDKGMVKLPKEVEAIIAATVESEYLTRNPKSILRICQEIRSKCERAKLPAPHCNTVRKRIDMLSDEMRISRRRGRKAAAQQFSPIKGHFPGADYPLSVVQIDHTKMDIILVDDIHRRPIGRPWITLAIDVFSRMVAGFYVSFDPPGALATGLCIAHAILAKDKWLAKHNVVSEWPCWGLPKTIHLDNAKEFRGNMLQRACKEYGINLEWRPVARPHFGGHIERLVGTLMKEIHTLDGTTFSNTRERGDYDSEKSAAMTLSDLESWLATYIVDVYHQREHKSIGMAPIEKFREGIFGSDDKPGTGLPEKIADGDRVRLDFMPFEERTIQNYGVVIDEIHYYHDVLRRWIGETDTSNSKAKRKFMFRLDPRDISTVWFYDPEVMEYYPIPYRDTSHPPISLWEMREMQRQVKESRKEVDERAIFEAYERMREVEVEAQGKTKAARRSEQRRKSGLSASKPAVKKAAPVEIPSAAPPLPDLKPFDELDDLS
ncbi:MAG: Mu transposase C-terminal domain-containing protein [Betaproteobacteria bacterium]|nr:Mu transposase C-terminal domain-containing protein [Betaproteobacteria bacterium]